MRSVLDGFKKFIMRGSVVDLAVAVVIGAAFIALINSLVTGLFTPLIAAIFGKSHLTQVWEFTVNHSQFLPGAAVDGALKFLVIAAVVYFLIVLPLNKLAERRARGVEPEPEIAAADIVLLREIRDLLAAGAQEPTRH